MRHLKQVHAYGRFVTDFSEQALVKIWTQLNFGVFIISLYTTTRRVKGEKKLME